MGTRVRVIQAGREKLQSEEERGKKFFSIDTGGEDQIKGLKSAEKSVADAPRRLEGGTSILGILFGRMGEGLGLTLKPPESRYKESPSVESSGRIWGATMDRGDGLPC